MRRILLAEVVLKIVQGLHHHITVPVLGNLLLPEGVVFELSTDMDLGAGTGQPDLGIRQVQLGITGAGLRQGATL